MIQSAQKQASHQRFLAFTEGLGGNDRGRLAEKWYKELFTTNTATQISIPAKLLNRLRGKPNKRGRRADMVDADGTLREIKHGSGKLSKRDVEQFEDYMLALQSRAKLDDPRLGRQLKKDTVELKKAVFTFADPRGAVNNKAWIIDTLTGSKDLTIEVFDKHGVKHSLNDKNVRELTQIDFGES